MNKIGQVGKNSYLFWSTLAASVPIAISVEVGVCCALIHWIEGQEMNLCDSCSSLKSSTENSSENLILSL